MSRNGPCRSWSSARSSRFSNYAAPNVRQPGFQSVVPGALIAVALWIVVSGLFAFYVANFGSYNKTYGSLGAVAISSSGSG